jgi:predicted regulator of Ras-like GTPase activity (Roadblock/LC7/MglB family)
MKIMKTIDEMQTNKNQQKREYAEEKDKEKEFEAEREELKKVLKPLTQINGYWGAGVFTPYGKLLEKKPGGPEIPIEDIGSMFYHPLNEARKMTKNLELGNLDIIQLHTDTNIIFVACHTDEKLCFFTILVIKSDGNVAMAKIQLKKTVETLKSILS